MRASAAERRPDAASGRMPPAAGCRGRRMDAAELAAMDGPRRRRTDPPPTAAERTTLRQTVGRAMQKRRPRRLGRGDLEILRVLRRCAAASRDQFAAAFFSVAHITRRSSGCTSRFNELGQPRHATKRLAANFSCSTGG